jgi:hypothetical protein
MGFNVRPVTIDPTEMSPAIRFKKNGFATATLAFKKQSGKRPGLRT